MLMSDQFSSVVSLSSCTSLTPAAVSSGSAVLPAAPRAVQSRATQHDRVEAFLRMQHWACEQVWEVGAACRTSVAVAGGTVRVVDLLATCHYVSARGKRRWIQLLAGRGGAVAGDEQLPVTLRLSQHRLYCLARQDGRAVDRKQDGEAGHRAAKADSRRACRAATTAASSSGRP